MSKWKSAFCWATAFIMLGIFTGIFIKAVAMLATPVIVDPESRTPNPVGIYKTAQEYQEEARP